MSPATPLQEARQTIAYLECQIDALEDRVAAAESALEQSTHCTCCEVAFEVEPAVCTDCARQCVDEGCLL